MCGSKRVTRLAAAALIAAAALTACVPFELKQILDGPKGKAITISPTSTVVPGSGSVTFAGDGGVPPYVYSIVSGGGTLDPVTGAYTAPAVTGTAVVRVTDKTGKGADATVAIQVLGGVPLTISPGALSLAVGSNVTFSAIGGTPPYTWILLTNNSGSPSVGASGNSWLYTARFHVGSSRPGASPGLLGCDIHREHQCHPACERGRLHDPVDELSHDGHGFDGDPGRLHVHHPQQRQRRWCPARRLEALPFGEQCP